MKLNCLKGHKLLFKHEPLWFSPPHPPQDYITSWPYLPLESTLEPRRSCFRETSLKKKRPSLHENVFSQSPLVPTFLTSYLSNSDKPVFHPLVDQEGWWGDLFETEVLTDIITFPDTLSSWEKAAKLGHQTCRLSIHWGLGLWRATSWEVVGGAGH